MKTAIEILGDSSRELTPEEIARLPDMQKQINNRKEAPRDRLDDLHKGVSAHIERMKIKAKEEQDAGRRDEIVGTILTLEGIRKDIKARQGSLVETGLEKASATGDYLAQTGMNASKVFEHYSRQIAGADWKGITTLAIPTGIAYLMYKIWKLVGGGRKIIVDEHGREIEGAREAEVKPPKAGLLKTWGKRLGYVALGGALVNFWAKHLPSETAGVTRAGHSSELGGSAQKTSPRETSASEVEASHAHRKSSGHLRQTA